MSETVVSTREETRLYASSKGSGTRNSTTDSMASASSRSQQQHPYPVQRSAPYSEAPSIKTPASSEVRSLAVFLKTVCPLLVGAAASMVEAGIMDEACFRALSNWPARERDALLLDAVKLSPFQLSLTRVVLGKLQKSIVVID
ncbi:hypothetical protein SCP_0203600 [Sparassis crispa]|uniref:Uncharacterized protein n=1 Tax=Sparassis crispa TaxID=139825 RepID=A0A401GAJ5_9APHY|nr:hypothetical protein SCP_0203600 [Sparassis crispa]GBE79163.1 hypothetical protein SCP_0203600 [Sparassis crispa]